MAKLPMGELENMVMDILWDHGGWMTPGEVTDVLAKRRPLSYSTILTILVRLVEKGRLTRHKDGRAYAYRPVQTREEHAAIRMREVLRTTADRPALLSQFVRNLNAKDRAQLRRLLSDRN